MSRQRLDVKQAAEALSISSEGVRKRIKRGTLESEKASDGKVYVWLDGPDGDRTNGRTGADTGAYGHRDSDRTGYELGSDTRSDALLDSLQDQVSYLRDQLALEREANRENRRLLAAALERMPSQLEAPSQAPPGPRDAPESASPQSDRRTAAEDSQEPVQRRSWLYRFFFGP